MRFSRFHFLGSALCAIWFHFNASAQDPKLDSSSVLEKLKDFDSIFESGFAVSGTWQHRDVIHRRPPLSLNVNRRYKLTFGGDRIGYRMEVIDYEKPTYNAKVAELTAGPDKAMLLDVRTREWGYWGNDLTGHHYEDTGVMVTPAGEASERKINYNTSLFGTRDPGPDPVKLVALWSMGRFFSKHLDRITRVENAANGRVAVNALGRRGERDRGRWELEIDPSAAWMVREARFYSDRFPNEIGAEMKNEGTVWSGPHCVPKESVCNFFGPMAGIETERLTFEPVVEKFDEKLYEEARQAVSHNETPDLMVHDYRVNPPRTYEPNRPRPSFSPPPGVSPDRKWLLVVNLVIAIALIFFFVLRNRLRTHTPRNP